ncbi:MAG: HupE/UreJ family protein [Pseudomonadota bacterium]
MMRILLVLTITLLSAAAQAHKASDSYLSLHLDKGSLAGQWDIALRDLDYAIGLDMNGDGVITWGELRIRHSEISAYALSRLRIRSDDQVCIPQAREHLVDHHSDGAYAVLHFHAACPASAIPSNLALDYRLLFDLDPQHRGLLRLEYADKTYSAIFSPNHARQRFDLTVNQPWRQFADYALSGTQHIWAGLDHILFLIALLLPSVLRYEKGHWHPVPGFPGALADTVKIVTAFTLAHSITLSLAVLGIANPPSRWVESLIAVSVILAAINNIRPIFHHRRATVALGFGLIHGFGFAGALTELGLREGALALPLAAFNLGIEAGQLAIVGLFLPVAFFFRNSSFYQRLLLRAGSCLVAGLASVWLLERAFLLKII